VTRHGARADLQPGSLMPKADPARAENPIQRSRTETRPCDLRHASVMPLCVARARERCQ